MLKVLNKARLDLHPLVVTTWENGNYIKVGAEPNSILSKEEAQARLVMLNMGIRKYWSTQTSKTEAI